MSYLTERPIFIAEEKLRDGGLLFQYVMYMPITRRGKRRERGERGGGERGGRPLSGLFAIVVGSTGVGLTLCWPSTSRPRGLIVVCVCVCVYAVKATRGEDAGNWDAHVPASRSSSVEMEEDSLSREVFPLVWESKRGIRGGGGEESARKRERARESESARAREGERQSERERK